VIQWWPYLQTSRSVTRGEKALPEVTDELQVDEDLR
jgi:hypothetical protein